MFLLLLQIKTFPNTTDNQYDTSVTIGVMSGRNTDVIATMKSCQHCLALQHAAAVATVAATTSAAEYVTESAEGARLLHWHESCRGSECTPCSEDAVVQLL